LESYTPPALQIRVYIGFMLSYTSSNFRKSYTPPAARIRVKRKLFVRWAAQGYKNSTLHCKPNEKFKKKVIMPVSNMDHVEEWRKLPKCTIKPNQSGKGKHMVRMMELVK
jgi:hypothetical protein